MFRSICKITFYRVLHITQYRFAVFRAVDGKIYMGIIGIKLINKDIFSGSRMYWSLAKYIINSTGPNILPWCMPVSEPTSQGSPHHNVTGVSRLIFFVPCSYLSPFHLLPYSLHPTGFSYRWTTNSSSPWSTVSEAAHTSS